MEGKESTTLVAFASHKNIKPEKKRRYAWGVFNHVKYHGQINKEEDQNNFRRMVRDKSDLKNSLEVRQ